MQQLKGYSSPRLPGEFDFGLPSLWTRSYFVSSAGDVSSEVIEEYNDAQPGVTMQRNVSTTVRVKLHSLTNRRADLLAGEYEAFQIEVHGGDADLYSTTKQQVSKVHREGKPPAGTASSGADR